MPTSPKPMLALALAVAGLAISDAWGFDANRAALAARPENMSAVSDPSAGAPKPAGAGDAIPTLGEMRRWRPTIKGAVRDEEPSLRERALRETGLRVGSQAALAQKTREQNAEVERFARWLTDIYRFDQLLGERGLVLPPVVIEARRHAEVNGAQLTKIEQSYKMIENAQVVSAPPTWRDFLIAGHYPPPVKPEGALLPQNMAEERVWSEAVGKGWEQGELQAFLAFKARVGELHRAFLGRVRYLVLLERGIVTAPAVRVTRRGVKLSGDELLIGRTEVTLSRLPRFRGPLKKGRLPWTAPPEVLTTYDDGSSVQ